MADALGRVSGGHVMAGCVVRTTAEIVLAILRNGAAAATLTADQILFY